MTTPAVSVLMLLYNRPHFMRQAIESVLAQTFGDFEFVIMDHASATPEPLAIAKEYAAKDHRIIVHRADNNLGVSAGRNMLLAKARGAFVATIEDDDWWAADKLQKQTEFLRAHEEVGAAYCSSCIVDAQGNKTGEGSILDGNIHPPITSRLPQLTADTFNGSGQLFRRAALNAIGGWRSFFLQADDSDLFYRLLEKYPVYFEKSQLLYYRQHGGNLTRAEKMLPTYQYAAMFSAHLRQNGKPDIIDDKITPEAVMIQAAIAGFLPPLRARKVAKPMLRRKKYSALWNFLAAYKKGGGKKRGKLLAKLAYWSLAYNRLGFWIKKP